MASRESRTRPVYKLKDYNGEPIAGKFYEQEIQLVEQPEEFRIEEVLRSRKRGGIESTL